MSNKDNIGAKRRAAKAQRKAADRKRQTATRREEDRMDEQTEYEYDSVEEVADHLANEAVEFASGDHVEGAQMLIFAAVRTLLASSDDASVPECIQAIHSMATDLLIHIDDNGDIVPDDGDTAEPDATPAAAQSLNIGEAPA